MKKFVKSWVINTLAVLVAVYVVPGIRFTDHSFWTPFVTALVLGILNAFLRPVLLFLTLPLVIFSLGLFTFVINALLLYLVSFLLNGYFKIDSFWSAFFGALVISLVSGLLNILTGTGSTRVHFRHYRRPPDSGPGGGGPIIDV